MSARALRFAAEGRLVVFVGAGVSSIAPTCLPSWWAMNQSVVAALRDRVAELVGPDRARALANAIKTRQEANAFPPEYQAEVITRRLRDSYFEVLQCLDSATPNAVHLGIAALVKAGRVPAVVTTNFDRALEAAFRELDVPFEACSSPAHFQALAGRLQDVGQVDPPCPIFKLHGSAEDPSTLIDTLSQRKRGFPLDVATCLRHLLRQGHWLFLGYSGADLMADENYLFLKPDASMAQGFTWLLRTSERPVAALATTREAYGDRSAILHSELPAWLASFSQPLLSAAATGAPELAEGEIEELRHRATAQVTRHAAAWAQSQRFDRTVLVFADLLEAVGEPAAALDLLQTLHDTRPAEERRSGHFGIVIDALANAYQQASRLEEATALFQQALTLYDPDTEQHLAALGNLALVYEKQGRTTDALRAHEQVLAFAEKSGTLPTRSVALHNLAMLRHRMGDDDDAERLYREAYEIERSLGREDARAFELNNLGELEVSRRRFDRAAEYLEEAVAVRERLGDDLGAAHSRANLANAHLRRGEHQQALPLYERGLEVFRRFGNRIDVARTLANIARLKEDTGKRDEALALVEEALGEGTAVGADPVRAQAMQLRGEIQQKQGHSQAAADTFKELIAVSARMHDTKGQRDAHAGYGIALKALGDLEAAIAVLREALALTDRHSYPAREWVVEHLADALNSHGLVRQERGKLDLALQEFAEALEIWRQRGSAHNEGQTLINVANTQVAMKRYPEAADTLRLAAGLLLPSDRDAADSLALNAADLYLWLDRLDEASETLRAIVERTTSYEERAERMVRIGALAKKHLERGAIGQALRLFEDCRRWNQEDGYPPDAAACLINIGGILEATGDGDGARARFEEARALLLSHPQHPLLGQVEALLNR